VAHELTCTQCHEPVSWTLQTIGSFIGNATLLYHYGRLLLPEPRYRRPGMVRVWGCDRCQTAGLGPDPEAEYLPDAP